MLPVTLMSVTFSANQYQVEPARLVAKSTNAARALMDTVDVEFKKTDVALQALATSPALAARDDAAFNEQAQAAVRRGFSENIVVVDNTGQQFVNTSVPATVALPQITDAALVKILNDVLASGKTSVSSLFLGSALKKPLLMVTVPMVPSTVVLSGSALVGPALVLAGDKLPSQIQSILANQKLPADWFVSVIDGSGAIVARSSDIDKLLGAPVVTSIAEMIQKRADGVVEGVTRNGTPALLFVTHSTFSGWFVVVGIPLATLNTELRRPFWWILGLTLGILVFSLTLAWFIGGRMARSVSTLRKSTVELGAGHEVVVPLLSFREANDVGEAINKASLTIVSTSASLRDSETRMRGILASAKDAIITFDDEQTVVIFNTAASVMFECQEADALGAPVTVFIPERFHDRYHKYIRTYRATGAAFGKAVGLNRRGLEFPV